MKRAGFTMIELIFVIVILGILAAVALPKFIGVSEQAHRQKVESFVGTLNRTVGPSMWAKSLADGTNGSVTALCASMSSYTDIPEEVTIAAGTCNFTAGAFVGVNDINYTDGNSSHAPVWSMP